MADGGQLTWKNVDAPHFSGSNDAYRTAALLLSKASAPLQEGLTAFQDEARKAQSSLLGANVLTAVNPMTALQSGTALAGIDPTMLSQEALSFAAGEAQRRATVGTTLANTANTRANTAQIVAQTDRFQQLTPLEVTAKGLSNEFDKAANPIKIGTSQTSLDAARLNLKLAEENQAIEANARKRYSEMAQSGDFVTEEGRRRALERLQDAGLDPREAALVQTYIKAGPAAQTGNASLVTLGAPSLSSQAGAQPGITVPNPFNVDRNDPVALSAALIKQKEGYDPNGRGGNAYYDVNAYRAGYGSDTITDPNTGTVRRVVQGDRVTPQMAEADLSRRIGEFQAQAEREAPGFNQLPANAKAALTSVIYNYGSLGKLPGVRSAIASGDLGKIANEVRALKDHNNGVNASRRIEEADIIAGRGSISGASGGTVRASNNPVAGGATTTATAYDTLKVPIPSDTVGMLQKAQELSTTASNLLNQVKVQSALGEPDAAITKALAAGSSGKSDLDVIKEIAEKAGNNKSLNNYFSKDNSASRTGIADAMSHIRNTYGLDPAAAGAFIENALGSQNNWFNPDTLVIDKSKLDASIKQYLGKDNKVTPEALNKGLAQVNGDKLAATIEGKVGLYEKRIAATRDDIAALTERNVGGRLDAKIEERKKELAGYLSSIQADLRKIAPRVASDKMARQPLD